MRKVLSFSGFLMLGLVVSQFLPVIAGEGYGTVKSISNILLYVCLSFIMINVGREFVLDKTRWKSYAQDYFIAMATAALPWFMIAIYYVFVLLPPDFWNSWEAWKENLLLSRFAAPTSAGILFTMLAAIGLKSSWIYKKIQVLAIFDDLDTIILMIPLQIMMIGLRWQLIIVVVIVFMLLAAGWQQLNKYDWRQDWKAILFYSVIIFLATQILYLGSKELYGEAGSIHIEVLLPAFVLGMIMKHKEHDTPVERKVSTGISFLFMFLMMWIVYRVFGKSLAPKEERVGLIMELPPYHKPAFRNILYVTFQRTLDIFLRALRVISLVSIVFFVLTYGFGGSVESSILYKVGVVIDPVTRFFGLKWQAFLAFCASAISKESLLGVLNTLYGAGGSLVSSIFGAKVSAAAAGGISEILAANFTKAEGLAFIFAISFNMPCVSALAATAREAHSVRWTAKIGVFYTLASLLIACIVYHIGVLLF